MTLITSALSGSVGNSDSMMDEAVEHERPTIASIELTAYDLTRVPPALTKASSRIVSQARSTLVLLLEQDHRHRNTTNGTQEEAEIKLEDEDGNDVAGGNGGDDEVPADKV